VPFAIWLAVMLGAGRVSAQQSGPHGPGERTALQIVEQRANQAPNDPSAQYAYCVLAEQAELYAKVGRCAERLRALSPNDAMTWYFSALAAYDAGEIDAGDAATERAKALGLLRIHADELDRMRIDATSSGARLRRFVPRVLLWWVATFAGLAVLGLLLSRWTMNAIRKPAAGASGKPGGAEGLLRRSYALVLWIACAYYYVSIPIALLLLVVGGTAFLYASLHQGVWVNVYLLIPIIIGSSIAAVLRGLSQGRESSRLFHDQLDLDGAPELRALLAEVASRIGTRPVDVVFLTPWTELAVLEQGGMRSRLLGGARRCLIVGIGVLDGMTIGQLKAILAHEYGHFHNEDTAGGGFALAVRRSSHTTLESMVRARADRGFNPAWLFFFVFHHIFLRISLGATRLQEALADRWAAHAYGAKRFVRGLQHVVRQSISFDLHVRATVEDVLRNNIALTNLFAYTPEKSIDDDEANALITKAWKKAPSPYDSHPSPETRVASLKALAMPEPPAEDGEDGDAWDLFPDRVEVEERMTRRALDEIEEGGLADARRAHVTARR
jgi:Zn-dependent protease with chaperone function